eukprot:TRINITY_DN95694_c0_g1_i1.p1 TRINITY_DN95694_c0_g1~~TRINITY_DN95694_c0_g1_i1.p1  ORF type:complete len:412 (-),score=82.60 TRINITY_DN95694_c0_g1_i1:457-1629(-)
MELAGGFYKGDRVICGNRTGIVLGPPARAACRAISVAVHYDIGEVQDERAVNLRFLDEQPPMPESAPLQQQPAFSTQGTPIVPRLVGLSPQETADVSDQRDYLEEAYDQEPQGEDEQDYNEPDDEALPEDGSSYQQPARSMQESLASQMLPQVMGDPGAKEQLRHHDFFKAPDAAEEQHTREVDGYVDAVLDKIRRNFANLRMAFRALDRSNTGYVSRADFYDAMEHIFLSAGLTDEDVQDVAERFDLGRDGDLSYDEFVSLVEGAEANGYHTGHDNLAQEVPLQHEDRGQRLELVDHAIQQFKQAVDRRYYSMRDAFRAMDKSRSSYLSPSDFAMALGTHGIMLGPDCLEDAWRIFDPEDTGFISYAGFCKVMSQRSRFGKHLHRQAYK